MYVDLSTSTTTTPAPAVTKPTVERIGRAGEFWATRYADGWTIFGIQSGAVATGQTREEADRILAWYEAARTHDHEETR